MNCVSYRRLLACLIASIPLALTAQTTSTPSTTSGKTDTTKKDKVIVLEKFEVTEMADFADQAIPNTTPVAFTEFNKQTISNELGSRDIPLVLNSAPSVYATEDSGGAGDARINVRGFSQRNTAILINGVPTNDMENGWLYWSNWDGLGDVTQSIQMQRGLSNTSLPIPGVGGVVNIITDPSASTMGGSLKLEAGSNSFYKATAVLSTGMLQDKFALTVGYVTKEGDGRFSHGWTDGQGYYLGSTWFINKRNRLELYAIAAPQQHGQRYDANIAVFSSAEAKKMGYTDAQIAAVDTFVYSPRFYGSGPINAGFDFNSNGAPIDPSYSGQQYYWGSLHSRHEAGYMNERVNYFNKPQMNLNWFSQLSDSLKLATVFYYSGGRGGGSGTYGSLLRYDHGTPLSQNYDFNATILRNQNRTPDATGQRQSYGILRNSVNNQDTYGIVTKLTYTFSPDWSFTAGADWRTATIDHFREVRDLLGGDYYYDSSSEFWSDAQKKRVLGDKINYYNTNTVDWLGLFATAKYSHNALTAFGTVGYSTIDYTYRDHFHKNASGGEIYVDSGNLNGKQVKGGVNYKFTENLSAFVNAGWVSKVPIFDGAIDDTAGHAVPDPVNEKFTSYEAGIRWDSSDHKFYVTADYYHTIWKDRTEASVNEQADLVSYLRGINTKNEGFELEAAYKPNHWVRFDVSASVGNWTYTDDVAVQQYTISTRQPVTGSNQKLYIAGLKIGDQPQTGFAYAATVYPVKGLSVRLEGFAYSRFYADYDPLTRTSSTDRGQAWQIPSYQVYNLHVNYRFPEKYGPFKPSLFLHVFNLLDETYISDATDNSSYEGLPPGYLGVKSHSAQSASVFFGSKIRYNGGVRFRF